MNKKEVYEALRFQIVTTSIGPSEILNEKDLMNQFKIGRSPLRDVLFKLQEDELLTTLPRLGYMVTPLDISEVKELIELRRELEGFAGTLAAERITPPHLEQMKAIIQKAEAETPEEHDIKNFSEYFDTQFHNIIYEASGNRKLNKILQGLHVVMMRIWFHVGLKAIGFTRQAQNFHEVLEALTARDSVNARNAMENHVELFATEVRDYFI